MHEESLLLELVLAEGRRDAGDIRMGERVVRVASRAEVDALIREGHYLHRWPGVVVRVFCIQRTAVEGAGRIVGALVFALPPRETAVRYGVSVAWELARLYVVDSEPKNTESWFIGQCIHHLRRERAACEVLVSYADPSAGHAGTIYRAANWIADGRTDDGRKTPRFDYLVDGKKYSRRGHVPEGAAWVRVPRISKFRYIYWMRDHERRRRAALVRCPRAGSVHSSPRRFA